MKRIPLVTLLVLVLAMVVAGCGVLSQKTEPTSSVPPVKEVKMVHPSGIPVLMYHKVGDDKDNDAVIREDLFREQMKFLKDNGYNPLTMEQLYEYVVNGAAVPEKPVVLTFDDGYADTYSIVYPIMKEYGFPATVFINPGDIGTRLTWDQVREMHKNGITIANHGFQHIEMGQLSEAKQIENITKAQEALAKEVGIKDNPWFCYPYGDKNEFTDSASKKAGIKMGMAMKSGWAHTGDNPYNILRVWVGNAVDIKHFEERISTEHFAPYYSFELYLCNYLLKNITSSNLHKSY